MVAGSSEPNDFGFHLDAESRLLYLMAKSLLPEVDAAPPRFANFVK
jgi:hypothetical protein